jgi:hypothetical protein
MGNSGKLNDGKLVCLEMDSPSVLDARVGRTSSIFFLLLSDKYRACANTRVVDWNCLVGREL